jgi:hypothetical protein
MLKVASLRAMYERGRTLFDHQQVACTVLGFQWMSEHQRRSLVRELRDEVARCADRDQLPVYKANRKVNEINGLPRPPPRQC